MLLVSSEYLRTKRHIEVQLNKQADILYLARKRRSIYRALALHDLVDRVNHALGGRQVGAMSRS